MKVKRTDEEPMLGCIDRIESQGMIEMAGVWVPMTLVLEVKKETEKAYYGNVRIVTDVPYPDDIYSEQKTWVPKSMSANCWWICTVKFEHKGKVANRRFDGYE